MGKKSVTVIVVRGWKGMRVTITTLPATKKSDYKIGYKGEGNCGDCGKPFKSPRLESKSAVENWMADNVNRHIKTKHE